MMDTHSKNEPSAKLSGEYQVEILASGLLRVVHVLKRRVLYFWLFLFTGFCFLGVSTALAGGGGCYPAEDDGFQWHKVAVTLHDALHDPSVWLLPAFMLWGAFLIGTAFCWLVCWDELQATQDLLEVRYYFAQRCCFVRRYTSGRIYLERQARRDSELNNAVTGYDWWLCLQTGGRRIILAYSMFGEDTQDRELFRIAELLSKQMGWDFLAFTGPSAA